MYSNLVLGYGDQVVKSQIPYSHTYSNKKSYIPSSGVLTAGLYSDSYYGLAKKNNVKYFYFPNTLSGATYRYGPYRDTADKLYLLWQRKLIELFGNDLTIKTHPKEMYKSLLIFDNQKVLNSSFMDVKDLVDVYIFDHIGTAFTLACSTDKPVIYFHLGIRNIHIDALEEIKKRTIFFDVRNGIPGMSEIRERLNFDYRRNCYTKKYSLGGISGLSRSKSLYTAIENYLNST